MSRLLWISAEVPDRNGQGGQRRQFHQIRELVRLGHEVTVLAPQSSQDDTSIRRIAAVRRPKLEVFGRFVPSIAVRLRSRIATEEWDAIVVSHVESSWLLPAREALRAPVLTDVHNVMSRWHADHGRPAEAEAAFLQERRAIANSTMLTTCSEQERRRLVEAHPDAADKTFAAPLGVDPDEWPAAPYSRERPVVAMFGSWSWTPNARGLHWFATEVWPRVRLRTPDALALVAGSGVEDPSSLPEGMTSVGRVADLAAFAAKATVVAVPVLEGVGAAVKFAESLATGAAVIATPDGANAFEEAPAFVSADPDEWAAWIAERLARRGLEPAPAPARSFALRELTWAAAVAPIDAWLRTLHAEDRAPSPRVSS
ncbi:glycosyltransferase family 4 protein [Microbacterium ulmi]|uniref:glycosyltransferase family 4 protein n=1 Tax=Microbacterium ulmi TaxID=179095 RepID=UPI00141E2476|nr:glycosyltransferase family 4 protein [Microbacterium ulmi]NII69761.1 glycosyltransferase involved in cell wall biosynthesis [Microbacterium ulmi]